MLGHFKEILIKFSVLVGIVIIWQLVCGVILPKTNPDFITLLPPPSLVLEQAIKLIGNGKLFDHILKSMERVLIAFFVASALAIPLGIAIGWWRRCEDMVDPLMEILASVIRLILAVRCGERLPGGQDPILADLCLGRGQHRHHKG
jgi:ABC-type nitrate/sulfonate/bicarbonate transport system permease component